MITFNKVSKSFGSQKVLKNIDLQLPRTGLIVIEGPSGCGKTTLLNLLSGLLDFQGDITIDNHHINLMNKKQMDEYRLKNYGFIFQDFKLFESENVLNNILFPLEVISVASKETKLRKCQELANMVGLKQSLRQKVNKLSGGEKQRVAIARALVNNPKIILADEPTGALDSNTANEVMDILEKVSAKSLVIVVSHDEDLAKKYADQIIKMQDGEIVSIKSHKKSKKEKYIPIAKMFFSNKKPMVPSSFLFHHIMNSIKQKKWRTMICNSITSLGLIGVGLATSLSSSISTNIKKSYSQIIDDTKITISQKSNEKAIYGQYAASYYEVMDIVEKNQEHVYDCGVTYTNDFDNFFPHSNYIGLADTAYTYPIDGISARHINEFRWLDIVKPETIYPEQISYLENDEVILSLTIDMVYDICYGLKIERTVTSLSRYLQTNQLKIYFDFRNDNWQYSDQQLVEVKGFTLEKIAGIYHNNHMWNEYMFEERMRFPSSDRITTQEAVPWVLKKIYYIYVDKSVENFLNITRQNSEYNPYIFEIADESLFTSINDNNEKNSGKRVLVLANTLYTMPCNDVELFQSLSDQIINPIYGSIGGYAIYPSSMMYGFANPMYFSGNIDSLEETIDIETTLSTETNEKVSLPDDVLCGHFSQSITGGVNFTVLDQDVDEGRAPLDLTEIVISSNIANKVFSDFSIGQDIFIGHQFSQTTNNKGEVIKKFKTVSLKVVGIINSDKNLIYHNSYWTLNFFQIMLGVSAFNLGVNAIMVDVKNQKEIPDVISKLKRAFPDYDVIEPMSSINESVNQICTYIEIALMCFSIIAVVISTMLLSICNYLYILENKKDIGLVRCIGVDKSEAKKFVVTHSMIMCFVSFALSSVELFLSSFLISGELAHQMGTAFSLSFNPLALVYMFALAFTISLLSSLFIARKVNKLDPLSALKS